MSPSVDYDHLAGSYDRRYEYDDSSFITQALSDLLNEVHQPRVLEAGCGTGHWLELLSPRVAAAFGLDLSRGMLAQADNRSTGLHLVRGRATDLPFPAAAFDLVYCVNAIHHFDDPQAYISRAAGILKPGGILAVIGSDPHNPQHQWYIYRYFEGVHQTDLARFPTHEQIMAWMAESGLNAIQRRDIQLIYDCRHGREVLEDPFLKKEATSQLALLSQEAYQAGLNRLQVDVERAEKKGQPLDFVAEISVQMLWGEKPASGQEIASHRG